MKRLKEIVTPPNFFIFVVVTISVYFFIAEIAVPFFGAEHSIGASDLVLRDRAERDSIIATISGTSDRAYVETHRTWDLNVKSNNAMGWYLFISGTVQFVGFLFIFWMIIEVMKRFGNDEDFKTDIDTWLFRIGTLLVVLGALSYLDQLLINLFLKSTGLGAFKDRSGKGSYFFFAFMAFAFMTYYSKGKELKEETELTI